MRALLVDEQRLFREGLAALLGAIRDVSIVGQAADARETYALVSRLRPDLVIMELALPGADGLTAAREIRHLRHECKLVVITACKDRQRLQSAWLLGIDACLTKDESADTLAAALASVRAGRRYLGPSLRHADSPLRILGEDPRRTGDRLADLSPREQVVFDLVVRGFSTKAVARELFISTKTVETHRAHINQKLAAHCAADLVRLAFRDSVPLALAADHGDGASRAADGGAGERDAPGGGSARPRPRPR